MRRVVIAVLALAVLVTVVLLVQPAAAACNTRYGTVSGGYRASMSCSGVTLDGFGTSRAEAKQQAQRLHDLYLGTGRECVGRAVDARNVGYRATVACETDDFDEPVDGYGQTLTDAMTESRELAALFVRRGRLCSARAHDARGGGYAITLRRETGTALNNSLDGLGTTFNDAALEAREQATLWAETGRFCGDAYTDAISGGWRVELECADGVEVSGTGATLTVAARNARLAAS